MKLWKKCLSGILSAAMLVGLVPTSALAVHAPIASDGGQGLAKEAILFLLHLTRPKRRYTRKQA